MPTEKQIILFLAANPEQTSRVKLDEEAHAIDDVLRKAEYRVFDLRTHWALRYGDLPELLLRYNPHIVHFSGHGSTLGEIALQDNNGKMHLVQPDALAALFRTLKDNIRCVVLNACYSQIQADAIAAYIDFVVGMNREVKDATAINFAAGFYLGLGSAKSIQTAFDLGCVQIGLAGIVQTTARPPVVVGAPTGTPVLGGAAAIPQLVWRRSDPNTVKLVGGTAATAQERERYRAILADFLIPLTNYLTYTYKLFDDLRRDTGIEHLEFDPEGLKRIYSVVIPKHDPRRITWMKTIERLQTENRKIINLIEENYGNIVLPEFRDACAEFKAHANAWEDFWTAVKDMGMDTPREIYDGLVSTPFPRSFPDALQNEYAEVQRRASSGE